MYLYLGGDCVLPEREVIGIFDLDNCATGKGTKNLLRRAEKEGRMRVLSDDIPKAFVVTEKAGQSEVFLSQVSAATLWRRAGHSIFTEKMKLSDTE